MLPPARPRGYVQLALSSAVTSVLVLALIVVAHAFAQVAYKATFKTLPGYVTVLLVLAAPATFATGQVCSYLAWTRNDWRMTAYIYGWNAVITMVVGLVYAVAVGSVMSKMAEGAKVAESQRLIRGSGGVRGRGASASEESEQESAVQRQASHLRMRFIAVLTVIVFVVPLDAFLFFVRRDAAETAFVEPAAHRDRIFLSGAPVSVQHHRSSLQSLFVSCFLFLLSQLSRSLFLSFSLLLPRLAVSPSAVTPRDHLPARRAQTSQPAPSNLSLCGAPTGTLTSRARRRRRHRWRSRPARRAQV